MAERLHLYCRSAISKQMMEEYPGLVGNMELTEFKVAQIDSLILQMTSWCVAGRVPSDSLIETVRWPRDAWEMFKDRWMPKWFTDRWPVRYAEREIKTTVNHYFVCPHLVTDPHSQHVKFMATGTQMAGRIR